MVFHWKAFLCQLDASGNYDWVVWWVPCRHWERCAMNGPCALRSWQQLLYVFPSAPRGLVHVPRGRSDLQNFCYLSGAPGGQHGPVPFYQVRARAPWHPRGRALKTIVPTIKSGSFVKRYPCCRRRLGPPFLFLRKLVICRRRSFAVAGRSRWRSSWLIAR